MSASVTDLSSFVNLLWQPGDVREVRILRGAGRTDSGYFDDPEALIAAARTADGSANIYVTVNPTDPALIARAANRIKSGARTTTSDVDVAARRWLPIDIDPCRPSGISATANETRAARDVARAVYAYLKGLDWPDPVTVMSGNGYWLLYPIDLPNDAPSKALVDGILKHLADKFDSDAATIDPTVSNAARIVALIGTVKLKGDPTPDRPHRRSEVVTSPGALVPVPITRLRALVPATNGHTASTRVMPTDRMPAGWVGDRLAAAGVAYREGKRGNQTWYRLAQCPFHPDDDQGGDCGVGEDADGKGLGHCFHNRGAGKGWQDFKAELGLGSGPVPTSSGDGRVIAPRPELVTDVTDTPGVRGDLAGILDDLTAHLRRFVWFARPEQAVAVALWIAHTHYMDAVEQSPILAISSPVKQSGKSRLLDVIETVVPTPWRIERPSEAVLYRRIERDHPTILLDEADTIFVDRTGQHEGIRAVFNAGNRRGTVVSRVMPKGRTFDLIDFTIFGPKAVAGIGRFPETIIDRSIVIAMTRKGPMDVVERLRSKRAAELGEPIRRSFVQYHLPTGIQRFTVGEHELPAELDDRGQDNWEPLLALAALAGGHWPAEARNAAIVLQRDRGDADDNAAITLLTDLRTIYGDDVFLPTVTLLESLHALDTSPWSEWKAGKPITARGLARLLDPFGISPDRSRTVRGYNRRAFVDAWERFLPLTPSTSVTSVTSDPPLDLHAEAIRIFGDMLDDAPDGAA